MKVRDDTHTNCKRESGFIFPDNKAAENGQAQPSLRGYSVQPYWPTVCSDSPQNSRFSDVLVVKETNKLCIRANRLG